MNISNAYARNKALFLVVAVSLGLHVLGLVVFGTFKIVESIVREEQTFEAPPIAEVPQEQPEYTVNLEQRNQSSAPPRPNPIVVESPEVTIPALDIDVNIANSSSYGRGTGGFGSSAGITEMREMVVELTKFGYSGFVEGTLEGTLFDLKFNNKGKQLVEFDSSKELEMLVGRYAGGIVKDFTTGSWNVGAHERKYKAAEQKLYGSFFIIPKSSAADAPKAFNAEKEMDAKAIMAIYRGSYTPTESGRFRFAGQGDDVLIVRANNRIILDGSWSNGYSEWDQNKAEKGQAGLFGLNKELIYGDWLSLTAGQSISLQILIAEVPGGAFGAYLLIQKEDEELKVFSTAAISSKEKRQIKELHFDASKFL
ncbi:MAG TPA: hypothetical protein DCX06_09070 [Opitutae bacterium]|nr:hypothetical protein [Opitutae bacterium]